MKLHILLPTDFSDNAWNAAVYALKLFEDKECTFHFLHSKNTMVLAMTTISKDVDEAVRATAKKELADLKTMAEAANPNANHDFDIIYNTDDLETAIEKVVDSHHIDFVVMGTKGATGAKEFFIGSNTVSIISKLKSCPVLIVPDDFDFEMPKKIAFPTDLNRPFTNKLAESIKKIAQLFDSEIHVVHIKEKKELDEVQKFNLNKIDKALEDYEITFHWMPYYTKKTSEINEFIEELAINLLVMVKYKHSFFEDLVREPVIKNIGYQPIVPTLIIPE